MQAAWPDLRMCHTCAALLAAAKPQPGSGQVTCALACSSVCLARPLLDAKAALQPALHLKGRSPVCCRMCCVRFCSLEVL